VVFGSVVVVMLGAAMAALIVMRSCLVVDWLAESATRTVKFESPEAVGVPLIAPAEDKFRPAGREPAETLQVNGGVPPVADRVAE
jgi:hypothetical protein